MRNIPNEEQLEKDHINSVDMVANEEFRSKLDDDVLFGGVFRL